MALRTLITRLSAHSSLHKTGTDGERALNEKLGFELILRMCAGEVV